MPDDKKDDVLNLLADCQLTIEYDADMTESGHQIDCSTFTLSGSLYSLGIFLEAFGISRRYEESWEDAVTREIEADTPAPTAPEECEHRWVILPSDKSMVVCTHCGMRYGTATRYPTSDVEC